MSQGRNASRDNYGCQTGAQIHKTFFFKLIKSRMFLKRHPLGVKGPSITIINNTYGYRDASGGMRKPGAFPTNQSEPCPEGPAPPSSTSPQHVTCSAFWPLETTFTPSDTDFQVDDGMATAGALAAGHEVRFRSGDGVWGRATTSSVRALLGSECSCGLGAGGQGPWREAQMKWIQLSSHSPRGMFSSWLRQVRL